VFRGNPSGDLCENSICKIVILRASAFKMHDFWNVTDAQAKQSEMTSFMKNLALAGASLIIFVLVGSGVEFGPTITEGIFNL